MSGHLPGIDYTCPVSSEDDIDRVYSGIDDLMLTGKFGEVDELLAQIDVTELSITLMLSYLSITYVAKDMLQNRVGFYDRVDERISLVDPARKEDLLQGLK